MKKKMLGLLLAVCIAMALVPMAAFAEGNSKTSITTVDELLQFAKAVDQGEYDNKTDAVVSLDADLDLTALRGHRLEACLPPMELCNITSAANFTETAIRFPIWIFPKTMERQRIRLSDFSVRFTALKFPA